MDVVLWCAFNTPVLRLIPAFTVVGAVWYGVKTWIGIPRRRETPPGKAHGRFDNYNRARTSLQWRLALLLAVDALTAGAYFWIFATLGGDTCPNPDVAIGIERVGALYALAISVLLVGLAVMRGRVRLGELEEAL